MQFRTARRNSTRENGAINYDLIGYGAMMVNEGSNDKINWNQMQVQTELRKQLNILFNMQKSDNHIIHIYGFDEGLSWTEKQLTEYLHKALSGYLEIVPQIKIRGKPNKFWGYISVDATQADKLNKLKKINVNGYNALIGQYYHDHQIFINKLDKSINVDQIKEYFSKFGKVLDVVTTVPESNPDPSIQHCYIQMESEQTVNQIILTRVHKLKDKQIKAIRTFKMDEDKNSDKKLILIVQGNIPMPETFEEKAIKYFVSFGNLRERPRLENITQNKSKIILAYTNSKFAADALNYFPNSEWLKESKEISLSMKLNYFLSKEDKIFVRSLKETTQNNIFDAFKVFGEVQEVVLLKNKGKPSMNAIIGFTDENAYKKALTMYTQEQSIRPLFFGKPYITIYLPPQVKKSFYSMKNSQKLHSKPFMPMNSHPNKMGPPPMGPPMGPPPPMMMPPPMGMPMAPMQPPKQVNPQ